MKTKKRVSVGRHQAVRSLSVALLSFLLVCSTSLTAFAAADTASLDPERTGSISVILQDESGTIITDGTLTIYKVADLIVDNGDMAYANTESFADCEADLDVTNQLLAADLAGYVSRNKVAGISRTVTEEGSITFSGLGLGLYLVMQTGDSTGYYTAEPFLVTLPLAGEVDENGENEWLYEVDATPKMAALTEVQEGTTVSEETTAAEETTSPEETTAADSGDEEEEEDTERRAEQEEEEPAVVLPGSGSSGSSGSSSSSGSSGTLPQTGQLNWPIPLLAVGGVALIVLGMFLQRKKDPVTA